MPTRSPPRYGERLEKASEGARRSPRGPSLQRHWVNNSISMVPGAHRWFRKASTTSAKQLRSVPEEYMDVLVFRPSFPGSVCGDGLGGGREGREGPGAVD